MKINPAKHTVCEKGHMYRHTKFNAGCPVCINIKNQNRKLEKIEEQSQKFSGLSKKQIKFLKNNSNEYALCPSHKVIYPILNGCPKCYPIPVVLPDHYCGKLMYSEEKAKERVRKSKGELKGVYYCEDCDAHHVTKQELTPSRIQWFKDHPKQFRNKHV